MKQRITFATAPEQPSAGLLLHVSIMLHQMRINPIAFTLEAAPERGEDTIWLLVLRDGPRFREFQAGLESTEGVRHLATTVIPPVPPVDSPAAAPNDPSSRASH